MADLTIWISGADFIKLNAFFAPEGRRLFEIRSFFAPEGSIFLKLFWLKSAEIRYFSRP